MGGVAIEGVAMHCPQCKGEDCVQIEINLEEETVQFSSCRRCEAKWWEREGDTIDLSDVLSLAEKTHLS